MSASLSWVMTSVVVVPAHPIVSYTLLNLLSAIDACTHLEGEPILASTTYMLSLEIENASGITFCSSSVIAILCLRDSLTLTVIAFQIGHDPFCDI